MNAAAPRDGERDGQGLRGGLPDDPDLAAFAAAAEGAFGQAPGPSGPRPALALAVPAPPGPAEPEIQRLPADEQAELAADSTPALPDVPHGDLIRQATISVAAEIAERFRAYQRQQSADGPAPSNAEVIFRALEACRDRYAQVVASRRPQQEPGRMFGAPVPGRRATSEARLSSQINYRPTYAEAAAIKDLAREAGAPSVSAFLDAVLDEVLPPLTSRPRGRSSR
jgi:hypothetical protein